MSDQGSTRSALSDLVIDDRHQARFKVHRSAFVSDEVLALERERVFG